MTNQEALALIRKNPLTFGCGVLSFALAIGSYLRMEALPDAEAELTQKTAAAERLALNIKHSAQLKEQAESMAGATTAIGGRIVRASELGNNTQYFYKIESATGVKILDLRQTTAIVAKPAKGSYAPVGFSVTVQGTFPQILGFLRQVESGAHYSRVLTATCSANASARTSPLTLALSLELLGQP